MGKEQIVEHSRAAETGFESTRSGAEEERKMAVAVNNHGMSAPDPSPEIHPTCQRHASRIRWPANMSWLPTHLFEMRRADGMPANSHPLPTADPLRSPRSPDTASPIYPDRAIRPLPSRRLKSKLSPEQASHIVYPPDPPAPPALPLAAGVHGEEGPRGAYAGHVHSHPRQAGHVGFHAHHHHHDGAAGEVDGEDSRCTCGHDGDDALDSGDEEAEFDHPDYRYTTPTPTPAGQPGHVHEQVIAHEQVLAAAAAAQAMAGRKLREAAKMQGRLPAALTTPATQSLAGNPAAAAADGYESFENTSNKKKRKIPLSTGGAGLGVNHHQHQAHATSQLTAEMASMGLDGAGSSEAAGGSAAYASLSAVAAASGTGISGAGRGRYGRSSAGAGPRNGMRRPLGASNGYSPKGAGSARGEGLARVDGTTGMYIECILAAGESRRAGGAWRAVAAGGGGGGAWRCQAASSLLPWLTAYTLHFLLSPPALLVSDAFC